MNWLENILGLRRIRIENNQQHLETMAKLAQVLQAIEDGGRTPDFNSGSFQARGSGETLSWANTYYQAIEEKGEAFFLQQDDGGQSQIFV